MAVTLFISLFAVLLSQHRAIYSFFSVTVFRGESRVCLPNSLLDFTFFVLQFWVGKTNSNRKSIMKLSAK